MQLLNVFVGMQPILIHVPLKISAEVEDGYVKIKILGVEQRDYTVKMEYRVDDHPSYAAAFRCRYDKETGEQIYRKLDHTSTYLEDVYRSGQD